MTTYKLNPKYLFRSRLNQGSSDTNLASFNTVSQLWAPPFRKVYKAGRCNLAGQSMLYCSTDPVTTFFELSPKTGDIFTWIQFKCVDDLPDIGVIGVEDIMKVDDSYGNIFGDHLKEKKDQDQALDCILSTIFKIGKYAGKDSLHYNLTNAITQIILNKQKVKPDFGINLPPQNLGFVYPSVETRSPLGMNFVLHPIKAKKYLRPYRAYVMKIEKKHSANHYQAVYLRLSKNILADGSIHWERCYNTPIEYITDVKQEVNAP